MESVGCFGGHPEDRHFARQLDRHLIQRDGEARESRIEGRVRELLKGSYSPLRHDNMLEAFAELTSVSLAGLSAAFQELDDADAGYILRNAVEKYWAAAARRQAEEEEDGRQVACQHCDDAGCPKCDPMED